MVVAGAGALPAAASARAAGACGLALRGVTYDTGIETFGELSRLRWSRTLLERELDAIRDGLHCTAVSIAGSEIERLAQTADAALERGLHVLVQPRRYDRSPDEVLDHLARAARLAERLRRRRPGRVTLVAGCEHALFTPGIVAGDTVLERIATLTRGGVDFEELRTRLNAFLGRAAATARAHFDGDITYAAAEFEHVDWTPFDIVGNRPLRLPPRPLGPRPLARHRRWGKPILVCEIGCCTYRGAPRRGGSGYDIVDWERPRPRLVGRPVRSEATQARHIAEMLDFFETQDLLGAFVYTFISPDSPGSTTPRYDLDTASFAVVRVIRDDERDPTSRYRWTPKQAFHAIARHNRAASRGRAAA